MSKLTFEKRMGITHAEFFRLLPVALGQDEYERSPSGVSWASANGSGRVVLGPEGKRQIALLSVPSTSVTIELDGYDDTAAAEFLTRFDRAYQRGGG